jgi:hypothetical protein
LRLADNCLEVDSLTSMLCNQHVNTHIAASEVMFYKCSGRQGCCICSDRCFSSIHVSLLITHRSGRPVAEHSDTITARNFGIWADFGQLVDRIAKIVPSRFLWGYSLGTVLAGRIVIVCYDSLRSLVVFVMSQCKIGSLKQVDVRKNTCQGSRI